MRTADVDLSKQHRLVRRTGRRPHQEGDRLWRDCDDHDRGTHAPRSTPSPPTAPASPTRPTASGPALVIVDGALCSREMGPSRGLADALQGTFTVHVYDRRGRGESDAGATAYAVDREVEDLAAVIAAAGGHAHVFAASSGARARARGRPPRRRDRPAGRLRGAVHRRRHPRRPTTSTCPSSCRRWSTTAGRGDAVQAVPADRRRPGLMVAVMRLLPLWKKMTAVAHTLPYDLAIVVPFEQGRPLPAGLLRRRPLSDAGDRGRQEPGVPAQRPGGDRRRRARRRAAGAPWTDPHDQAEGGGTGGGRHLTPPC